MIPAYSAGTMPELLEVRRKINQRLRPPVVGLTYLLILALSIALWAPAHLYAQDIACSPTTALAKQHRTHLKHRDPADSSAQAQTVKVSQVLLWAAPQDITNAKTRKRDEPIAPRESEAFTVEGDLWRVIVEDNDCDFHLELAGPGKPKTAARVIVELPQGDAFTVMREKLLQELTANGYSVAVGKSIALDEPLLLTVTGYAFYDSAHYSKKNPQKGHSHGTQYVGTLWELHPIWKVTFADDQQFVAQVRHGIRLGEELLS